MSHILLIIDGMTDPGFCVSDYPNLSEMSQTRFVDTCQGQAPESLGCILRLLGVKNVPDHLRGYAEALGAGISVGDHDLILRGSWFGLDQNGRCTLPIPGPEKLETTADYRYYYLEQYKSLLVFPEMASEIHNIVTYPPYQCAGRQAQDLAPKGCDFLQTAYQGWLRKDRCMIPWGQSVPAQLPPFLQPAAVICGTTVVKGIANMLRMDLVEVPGATGDVDTNLQGKAEAALGAAEDYPFVLLHINGADEASHRQNAQQKRRFLQKVDTQVLLPLRNSGHHISCISDHGTDPQTGMHMAFLQPLFEAVPPEHPFQK